MILEKYKTCYLFQEFSKTLDISSNSRKSSRNYKIKKTRNVDRILLGPLTKDAIFLESLMGNPNFIMKKKDVYGEEVKDSRQDEVKLIIIKPASIIFAIYNSPVQNKIYFNFPDFSF